MTEAFSPSEVAVSAASTSTHEAAILLKWVGRIGFWFQVSVVLLASAFLSLTLLGRSFNDDSKSFLTSFAIVVSMSGIILLGVSAYFSFRYSHLAKRLANPTIYQIPSKIDILKMSRIGVIVALCGALICLIGAEVSAVGLLAKAISQPQGVAVYSPERVIRVLDIVLIVSAIGLGITHVLGSISSLWLLKQLSSHH